MKKTGRNQTDSQRFKLACRWCIYSWGAIMLGLVLSKPIIPSAETIGLVFILAGIVFALIAFCIATFGLVACRQRLIRFLIPLVASTPPLAFQVWTMP